jgi:ATP-binding cassette subfamily A (ABC1) protein 3
MFWVVKIKILNNILKLIIIYFYFSFSLLGLNGAGKTTTFKILTGEIKPTSGNAFINGYDIKREKYQALRNLGFCPQFDILPEYLTVKDTFKLIAGLRGLEKGSINKTITELIQVFKLDEFIDKLVQNLSGGNKRKVSSGIAFIGRPSVVILDEPTTGINFNIVFHRLIL